MNDNIEESDLKVNWTKKFLECDGFKYLLSEFMKKDITSIVPEGGNEGSFEIRFHLTQMAFILKMLRIFVVAAFSAEDPSTYEEVVLARKSSLEATASQETAPEHVETNALSRTDDLHRYEFRL